MDGAAAVNAGDRIEPRPWQNFKGVVVAKSVEDLHGRDNKLNMENSLTERGTMVAGRGYRPNYHDALTGSQPDGRAFPPNEDRNCRNRTNSAKGAAMLGHIDRKGLRDDAASKSWNSAHTSRGPDGGCSQNDLRRPAATGCSIALPPNNHSAGGAAGSLPAPRVCTTFAATAEGKTISGSRRPGTEEKTCPD